MEGEQVGGNIFLGHGEGLAESFLLWEYPSSPRTQTDI
jgi:hypothetical protein